MKIALLFPPPGNAFQPYSSLPALTAFMRREGYEVIQRDISIEAVEDLLTEKQLIQAWNQVQHKLERLEQQKALSSTEEMDLETLCHVAVSAEYVSRHIDKAKRILRDPVDFFDYARFTWATNIVGCGRRLFSAAHYPSFWVSNNFGMPNYNWTVADLLAATRDADQNIFLAYLEDVIVPSVEAENPDLVGISITYSGQIIPGFTLARLLKQRCPTTHLCLGGAIISNMAGELKRNPSLWTITDTIVINEGEHALLGLARALENESDLSAVPNLLYLDQGQVQATPLYVEDANDLPTPDYGGLPIELYLTPKVTALLPTERGCYWRRCAFCTISKGMRRYRPRKISLVLEDMKRISQQLNTRCFFLANDAIPPARMKALAQAISAKGLDFTWQTETRLEKTLTPETCRTLIAGGCRRLMLGLESGSQRVLDLMEKGITTEQATRVIHNCHDAGISVHVFLILGFPTESRQEARETLAFVQNCHESIHSLDYAQFDLNSGSKVYRNPEQYGIESMEYPPVDSLNGNVYHYQVNRGMTRTEVASEMHPEAARFFIRIFDYIDVSPRVLVCGDHPLTPYASLLLLNYLAHFGVTRFKDLPFVSRSPQVLPADHQQISNFVPGQAGELLYRCLNSKAAVVFNPKNGQDINLPAEAETLLSLCNGRDTVRQIATQMASDSEGVDFVKRYYMGVQLCARLIDREFLTVTGPNPAAGEET